MSTTSASQKPAENVTRTAVLYEVYDNRAVLEPIDDLVLLARETERKRGVKAARFWAGTCVKVTCVITCPEPLQRRVLSTEIVYTYRTKAAKTDTTGALTLHELRHKLRGYDGQLNPYRRRKW